MANLLRHSRSLATWSLLGLMGIGFSWWWCFQSVESIDERFGKSQYHRRWCWCHSIEHDWNRDGEPDFVGSLEKTFRSASIHGPLVSHRESSKCDGVLDVEVMYDSSGAIVHLSADLDRDEIAETTAKGTSAVALLESIRGSSCYPRNN